MTAAALIAHLPEIAALLAIVVFFGCMFAVASARGRFGIEVPATTGHPDFERVFRAQMNTLESLATFLPALFIAAHYASPALVGGIGLLWVAGRAWYAIGYAASARSRSPGFLIGFVTTIALWVIAVWGIVKAIIAA